MKKPDEPAARTESLDLEFPDWSGMDDSTARLTVDAAFQLCDQYATWFPEIVHLRRSPLNRPPKCCVEFVL